MEFNKVVLIAVTCMFVGLSVPLVCPDKLVQSSSSHDTNSLVPSD